VEAIPKPDELLALHGVTDELFLMLKRWFGVGPTVSLSLEDIDSAVAELGDPTMIAALAMRKLQALRLLAQPGVQTSTDVVVTIVQDLERALIQAPNMHLQRAAEATDWDAALMGLVDEDLSPAEPNGPAGGPEDLDDEPEDAETERFRELHASLHLAVRAVIEASDGEIRLLE
jgi:hypothetical protein